MKQMEHLDVSRETVERLEEFVSLVQKWNPKINLVSRGSLSEIWDRHIRDSAQLVKLAPGTGKWVDIGSGGGFPGIVVAIIAASETPTRSVVLVEADQRKCAFLRTAIRGLSLSAQVISKRIESLDPMKAQVLSARALAELDVLMGFADRHLEPAGVALFPKGENWRKEDEAAKLRWSYSCIPIKSSTNANAAILKIKDIARVRPIQT